MFLCFILRKESNASNHAGSDFPVKSLSPSDFSRAYFKNIQRTRLTENENLNSTNPVAFDIQTNRTVFPFSAPTPRNLVFADVAGRSRQASLKSLKRHYDWINTN